MSKMTCSWIKLANGNWGVRGPESMMRSAGVTVTQGDGTTQRVLCHEVIWTGDGVVIASLLRDRPWAVKGPHGLECSVCGEQHMLDLDDRVCDECGNRDWGVSLGLVG